MKLSYYPGCSLGSTAKEYDYSARAVSKELGLELEELNDWVCCGATSAHSTNHYLSVALPSQNLALLQKKGQDLAIPCSACYNRVKKADYTMRHDESMRQDIEKMLDFTFNDQLNVYSLVEAIVTHVGAAEIAKRVKKPLAGLEVVCYYGCLMVRPPQITGFDNLENPMSLDNIVQALGAKVINWSYKTDCCGANLSLTSSHVVEGMVGRLLDAAKEAGASALVTACPLCQTNLEMRRKEYQTELPTFYFTELIGLALDLPQVSKWLKLHLIDPRPLLQSLSLTV